jgi:hypothetical protein
MAYSLPEMAVPDQQAAALTLETCHAIVHGSIAKRLSLNKDLEHLLPYGVGKCL